MLPLTAFPLSTMSSSASHIHNKYTLLEQIGKGTYSAVFLAKDASEKQVVIKKYMIYDPAVFSELEGISPNDYLRALAEKELRIGQLTDHPHIVKIKEMGFEEDLPYIVMDFVEGQTFNPLETYPFEMRIAFMQQLLSAIEHLLLRNIIVDDLWSENIIISPQKTCLTLIDLSGNDMIGENADMPLSHYLDMIEHMLTSIEGTAVQILNECRHLIPESSRQERISFLHIKPLVYWIKAIQKSLSSPINHNTIYADSMDTALIKHTALQSQHPDHISFNTAQNAQFITYSLVAAHVLKQFNPGKYPASFLENFHFLRYPSSYHPKSIAELFQLLPLRDDYDTASSLVGETLISCSPSSKETESEESAWGIFAENEREAEIEIYLSAIFKTEKVAPVHFEQLLNSLVEEAPQSQTGLLYNYFIPKQAPLHKALYLSKAYGIPSGNPLKQNTVSNFYDQYSQGLITKKNPQLRFLPSALTPENGFNLNEIKSYRFTTIPAIELDAFTKKIESVVSRIFENHLEEMFQLAGLAQEAEQEQDPSVKQQRYQTLCHRHLIRRDVNLALYYWNRIENKAAFLPGILICMLGNHQLERGLALFQEYETILLHKEQLAARFALMYLEKKNQPMLEYMLGKISQLEIKQFVLLLASALYPEYATELVPGMDMDSVPLMSDDELIYLALPH